MGARPEQVSDAIRGVSRTSLVRVRGTSRAVSRDAWRRTTGLDPVAIDRAHNDNARAWSSADSLRTQWRDAYDSAVAGGSDPGPAMREAVITIEYAVDRTATTEVVDAFNDEADALALAAGATGLVVAQTWEGILDTRTCPECEAIEGVTMVRPERFDELPPLHPLCRCFLSTWLTEAPAATAAA